MRRSLFAVSAITTFGILYVVTIGILVNNMRQPRPITAQTQPTPTTQTRPTTTAQPLPTCGSLNYAAGQLMTGTSVARDSATCFAKAVSACHSATLSAKVMGVDTNTTYHFSISSACKATLAFTNSVVGGRTTSITATCQRVTATADALDFMGCGTLGDIHLSTT